MEYWYNKIHELETGKYGLKAKQDVLIDMIDVKYQAAPEEFKEQIERDLEKNFEYEPEQADNLKELDNLLEAKQMTIKSYREKTESLYSKVVTNLISKDQYKEESRKLIDTYRRKWEINKDLDKVLNVYSFSKIQLNIDDMVTNDPVFPKYLDSYVP